VRPGAGWQLVEGSHDYVYFFGRRNQ
jgi:hypothetical protein